MLPKPFFPFIRVKKEIDTRLLTKITQIGKQSLSIHFFNANDQRLNGLALINDCRRCNKSCGMRDGTSWWHGRSEAPVEFLPVHLFLSSPLFLGFLNPRFEILSQECLGEGKNGGKEEEEEEEEGRYLLNNTTTAAALALLGAGRGTNIRTPAYFGFLRHEKVDSLTSESSLNTPFSPLVFFLADSRMKRWGKLLVSPVGRHWRVIEQLVGLRRGFSVSVQRNGEILDCSFDRDNLQFVYWNSSSPLGLAPTKRWEEGKQQTDKRPGSQVYNVDIGRGHAGITRIRCVDAFFLCSFWARPM